MLWLKEGAVLVLWALVYSVLNVGATTDNGNRNVILQWGTFMTRRVSTWNRRRVLGASVAGLKCRQVVLTYT